jgi:hypothetical protein
MIVFFVVLYDGFREKYASAGDGFKYTTRD